MMMIETTINRVRAYRRHANLSKLAFGKIAGVPMTTSSRIDSPNWNPTVSTLRKLEAVIPPDFVPPEEAVSPQPERSPTMAKKPCGKGGRKK